MNIEQGTGTPGKTNSLSVSANGNVSLNGSVIGGRKLLKNVGQNISKSAAISRLKNYNPPLFYSETAICLEIIFGLWPKKPHHWDFVAEYYTLKSINSVIHEMQKRKLQGGMPIEVPGAYFTKILTRFHHRRKRRKEKYLQVPMVSTKV